MLNYKKNYKYEETIEKIEKCNNPFLLTIINDDHADKSILNKKICYLIREIYEFNNELKNIYLDNIPYEPDYEMRKDMFSENFFYFYKNYFILSEEIYMRIFNLNSQQLKALEKKEWENTFTLRNLHARWKGSTNLDFDNNFKKFTDDVVPQSVKETKQFIKDFIDPDILEKKQKYFSLSTDTGKEVRPELKKTLFEASQGLNNFQIVPLKKHIINEGVHS